MQTRPASFLVTCLASVALLTSIEIHAQPGDGKAAWQALDTDGDRSISLEEFRSHEHRFLAMDLDGNGVIEFSEARTFHEQKRAERQRARFDRLDLNSDGLVTLDEAVESRFQHLDTNDDGVLSRADRRKHGHRHPGHGIHRQRHPLRED